MTTPKPTYTPKRHAAVCRWMKGHQVDYDAQACARCRHLEARNERAVQAARAAGRGSYNTPEEGTDD